MTTPLDLLVTAKERVQQGWCQEYPAVDRDGNPIFSESTGAVAWCLFGGLQSRDDETADIAEVFIHRSLKDVDPSYIRGYISWNDAPGRTQSEVLKVLDKAIELASS